MVTDRSKRRGPSIFFTISGSSQRVPDRRLKTLGCYSSGIEYIWLRFTTGVKISRPPAVSK